eukprot:scaffold10693_cov19-Tisochrysis_lutea.AAC.1
MKNSDVSDVGEPGSSCGGPGLVTGPAPVLIRGFGVRSLVSPSIVIGCIVIGGKLHFDWWLGSIASPSVVNGCVVLDDQLRCDWRSVAIGCRADQGLWDAVPHLPS